MKRICFVFNHFQFMDGICRSVIDTANYLSERSDVEVTLLPVYKFEKDTLKFLNPNVKIRKVFGFYFRGMDKFTKIFIPKLIYKKYVYGKFDIEIPYQAGMAQKIINSFKKRSVVKRIGWIHFYHKKAIQDYKQMDMLVSVSKEGAENARKDLKNEVTYCYNPINDEKIVKLGTQKIPLMRNPNEIQLVTVGRLSSEKGYARLISIMARLRNEGYNPHLWIVGDGPERNNLAILIDQNNLNDNVVLVGSQSNPHAYTSKADVFVCSSFLEGYSTACTEALILGVPVISTHVCGAEEIIYDSECGILTELDDDSLYAAIKKLFDNPGLLDVWRCRLAETKIKFSSKERLKQLKKIFQLDQ